MDTFQKPRVFLLVVYALAWLWGPGNSAIARPPEAGSAGPTGPQAIEADAGTGGGAALGFPLCESTGFEANEPTCNWEAGFGLCGSTFICKDTSTDGPYATTCNPPLTQPDNCCVNAPNPGTGWYMSITAQHCQEPHISTDNPASGSQHLRFQRSTLGGNPAGCVAPHLNDQTPANLNCRHSAFTSNSLPPGQDYNPGVTITSFDIAREEPEGAWGAEIIIFQQSPAIGAYVYIDYWGVPWAYDFGLGDFIFLGYMHGGGTYDHFQHIYDVCGDSTQWFWNGHLVHLNDWDGRLNAIEQTAILYDNRDNLADVVDIDNFSVTRYLEPESTCPHVCGDGIVDERYEECEPGTNHSCCPDQCGAIGSPTECQCPDPTNSIFVGCKPREVFNGVNGPFISDGGLYTYTADAPFTSVDTCAVSYDSQIFWGVTADCGDFADFNDDCWDNDYAGAQSPGDPNASCYGGASPNYQSCVCNETVPGTAYTFLVAEWAPASQGGSTFIPPLCSETIVNIVKKTSCDFGAPISGGACCDQLAGAATTAFRPQPASGSTTSILPTSCAAWWTASRSPALAATARPARAALAPRRSRLSAQPPRTSPGLRFTLARR